MENLIPLCINAAIEGGIWGLKILLASITKTPIFIVLIILVLSSKLKKFLSH